MTPDPELPLKIRVDIRDLWDSSKSDVQASISALEKTLGYRIEPIIQWSILWDELKDRYTDKTTFVPSIARIVNAWYSRLLWRLDSDNFPEWTEELLGHLSNGKKQLIIEPSPPPHTCPKTTWNFKTSSFYLGIPKLEPPQHTRVVAAFDQDFDDLLKQVSGPPDDGWDDLAAEPSRNGAPEPRRAVTTHTVGNSSPAVDGRPKVDRLPRLGELPRPNELFAATTPYILTLDTSNVDSYDRSSNPLVIRCSHEPTLELLSSYINRWGRQDVDNGLKVTLAESAFCNGMNDTLIVEPLIGYRHRFNAVNPAFLLAFIEGILGYKMVHTNGHNWVYRSDTMFK